MYFCSVKEGFSRCLAWLHKSVYKSFTRLVLVSYITFAIVLLIVLFFVLLSLYLTLKQKTSDEIRQTLSKQADDNMLALSSQGSSALWEHIAQVRESMRLTAEVMVSMQNETTFSLRNLQSYTVDESCQARPCKDVFAYVAQRTDYDQVWLGKTSRLEPLMKLMVDSGLFPYGIAVHFVDWGFSRVMPPSIVNGTFTLATTFWYQEWITQKSLPNATFSFLISSVDQTTTPLSVVLMQDLLFNGKSIGLISARLSAEEVFRGGFADISYMNRSIVLTIHRKGGILNEDLTPTTIEALGLTDSWVSLLSDPYTFSNTTHKLAFRGEQYRYATAALGDSLTNSTNWWYVTALAVKEADILDLDINNNYATDMALWMLVYPIVAAIICLFLGSLVIWRLNDSQLRTPMNKITEAMSAMKKGEREQAKNILSELGQSLRKSEIQRLVLGMYRLIKEVTEKNKESSHATEESNLDRD